MSAPPLRVRPKRLSNVDLEWEKRAEELQLQGLSNVRATAKQWVATLSTLFGLLSALLIVKGRTDISNLRTGYQVVVGVLLLIAVLTAAFAVWQAAKAAQGAPEELGWLSGPKLRQWELERARTARGQLRDSRIMAVVAMAALASAIAFTWFGEAKAADKPEARTAHGVVNAKALLSGVRDGSRT